MGCPMILKEWWVERPWEHSPALKELVVRCYRRRVAYRHGLITELGDNH